MDTEGLGLAFLLEMRDSSLRSERDAEFALRLPVLAVVPSIEPISSKRTRRPTGEASITSDTRLGMGA